MQRLNWTTIALIGGLVVLLLLVAYFASSRNPDQDKLTGNQVTEAKGGDPEKRCASQQTYDFIKRDLFKRAAQMRGSDQAAYDRLAGYAVVRMVNPVMESENSDTGAVNCSGSLSLDLPPGVAVVGGRRTLTSDVDYTVQPAADGSGTIVLLRNADAIVAPLATLGRVSQPSGELAPQQGNALGEPAAPAMPGAPTRQPQPPAIAPPAPPAEPPPPQASSARPSFNCANARTRGEVAVCSDSGLASLDRQMASQFNRALSSAGPGERALLQRTRSRFLSYRDACRSDACIADAYRGRMREISDIMAGRWQPH
jgi:hypothetical protein